MHRRQRHDLDRKARRIAHPVGRLEHLVAPILAVGPGRQPIGLPEGPAEGFRRRIAGPPGDLADLGIGIGQSVGGARQPQPPHGGSHALALHGRIDPVPVPARHGGNIGQQVEIELVLEVIVEIIHDPPDPRCMALSGRICRHQHLSSPFVWKATWHGGD